MYKLIRRETVCLDKDVAFTWESTFRKTVVQLDCTGMHWLEDPHLGRMTSYGKSCESRGQGVLCVEECVSVQETHMHR